MCFGRPLKGERIAFYPHIVDHHRVIGAGGIENGHALAVSPVHVANADCAGQFVPLSPNSYDGKWITVLTGRFPSAHKSISRIFPPVS